ncbi:tyrosine-type recombinase/integrase (plasmid) [Acaryochloris sp. 'Moss Beach']|uniref:tyrosine-type recombinase/integrase n=1 Tax=Acaryochloris sp. 'Moss Beach' TaxID=2740837 RepID=UPI001F15DA58|nr:tyrosine-type recombinase/integrase [Acaryochloris sp. 'Moss Beach']UJB73011.1 tyrosine-type recombinase/integrase [Acaryochloris sp. 'Moss Beach']
MSQTLAAVTTLFLDRQGLAKSTQRSYELTLLPLLKLYGHWPIEILDRQEIVAYLDGLTHLSYTTHRRHQAILQSLLNFALENGDIQSNPIANLKQRKPEREKDEHSTDQAIRYLTPQQLQRLYQVVTKDRRMNALIHLLHRSGARISEVLALDLETVNLQEQKFQVIGKGNKQRWCYFSADAAEALEKYCRNERHGNHPALFTAEHRFSAEITRMSYHTAYHHWVQLTRPIPELEGIRLHDLRHTFATERVGLMGIEELRALMGHEKIQTTLRYQKVTSGRAEMVAHQALDLLIQSSE